LGKEIQVCSNKRDSLSPREDKSKNTLKNIKNILPQNQQDKINKI
jgi:hypothetical protein